jgi:hypothetical protein
MVNVHWLKCGRSPNNVWCGLNTVDLATVRESGVYIIWHSGNPSKVVYVGQGDPISARLAVHRQDRRIQAYKDLDLRVTWASLPAAQRDGVERHLANRWNPLVGDAHPDVSPIEVNSPFG